MSNQKSIELYREVWSNLDKLRGSIDGWDFKQYVLGMIFYRYICEDFENFINESERKAGDVNFEYSEEKDSDWDSNDIKSEIIDVKGLFLPPSHLFKNILKNAEKNIFDLNERLRDVFNKIESTSSLVRDEPWFKGLFKDIDVNSNKLGSEALPRNTKLAEIMKEISSIPLDNVGDLYEFLMGEYAAAAGKSGGEYYTPPEVSNLLVKLAINDKKTIKSAYDPACGSGSLLLKFIKFLGEDNKPELYGQEINLTTYNLCKMNMILHNVNYSKVSIEFGDTLESPKHRGQVFDAVVSNPPYSSKWKGSDSPTLINDERFNPAGVLAPKSKADLAFIMHSLHSLSSDGVAAIICFPGIMYRGSAEQKIRQYLVDNKFVDCIIQVPENLFYGTSISTCVMVLRRNKQDSRILFINAEGQFEKIKNRNRLSDENIEWIMDKYRRREDIDFVSKLVDLDEVKEQDYNLSVSSYVEKEDTKEPINIKELNAQIAESVKIINELRKGIDETIRELEENGDFFKISTEPKS